MKVNNNSHQNIYILHKLKKQNIIKEHLQYVFYGYEILCEI